MGKKYPELVIFWAYKPGLIVPPARVKQRLVKNHRPLVKVKKKEKKKIIYLQLFHHSGSVLVATNYEPYTKIFL